MKKNVVLYIINPFNHAAGLADICSAFWHLVQNYTARVDKQRAGRMSEIVLQIVPLDFITSSESMVVPTQAEYFNLALEVYGRCCSEQNSGGDFVDSAPPVVLAEPVPAVINFKLSPEGISPLRESRSLHLAYSKSLDQRWITVAWTDDRGSFQKTISYCRRYRNTNSVRSVTDVRNAIWATTKGIIEKTRILGRVVLVNTEPMDRGEIDSRSIGDSEMVKKNNVMAN